MLSRTPIIINITTCSINTSNHVFFRLSQLVLFPRYNKRNTKSVLILILLTRARAHTQAQ